MPDGRSIIADIPTITITIIAVLESPSEESPLSDDDRCNGVVPLDEEGVFEGSCETGSLC